jgi:hypothetical protein
MSKRLQTSFPNYATLAPLWAKRELDPRGERFHVREHLIATHDSIFSYGEHFEIARHIPDSGATLFSTATHSKSTAKHCSWVWRALYSAKREVIYVPELCASWSVPAHVHEWVRVKFLCAERYLRKALRSRCNFQCDLRSGVRDLNCAVELARMFPWPDTDTNGDVQGLDTIPATPDWLPELEQKLYLKVVKARLLGGVGGEDFQLPELDPHYKSTLFPSKAAQSIAA